MALGPKLSPEMQAYLAVAAIAAAIVLLADLALLWTVAIGCLRGKPLLARRWSAGHVLVAFQVWLLITVGFAIGAAILLALVVPTHGPPANPPWSGLLVVVTLVVQNMAMAGVVLFTVLIVYDQHLVAAGLSHRNWRPKVAIGLVAAALLVPLNPALEHLSVLSLRHAVFPGLVQRAYQEQFDQLLGIFQGPGGLALGIVLTSVIAPFGEELFFRGFAYRCFRARWGPVAGMIASAAFFALIHLDPAGVLPIFVLGCALAYLYERTGSLVAPITLHAANNLTAMLVAYFGHGR